MYKGTREIFNLEKYNEIRKENIDHRMGAIEVAKSELEGLINFSEVARQYFGKSQSWFSQRLNGCLMEKKTMAFSADEARKLADSFRHIADRLIAHADEIEAVADKD